MITQSIATILRDNQRNTITAICMVFIYLLLEILRATYASPVVDGHGDASYKWELARLLALGDVNAFDSTSHHALRWGGWVIAYLFNLFFSDNLTFYLLSAMIPAIAGGAMFVYLTSKYLGASIGLLFVLFWLIDTQLFHRTYTLMPSGSSLFPLAILTLLMKQVLDGKCNNHIFSVTIGLVIFWLYGIKETNLFFAPAVLYVLYKYSAHRYVVSFLAIFVSLYILESFILWQYASIGHPYGRLYELVFGSATHLELMKTSRLVQEHSGYYDNGISYRFYKETTKYHTVIYFAAAFISISNVFRKTNIEGSKWSELVLVVSLLYLSFFFVNGFFVGGSDLSPLQPLRARYLVPMIPLALILLGALLFQIVVNTNKSVLLPLFALAWFFIADPIHRSKGIFLPPYHGITAMNKKYTEFALSIESVDCVVSNVQRQLNIISRWPPLSSRGERFAEFSSRRVEKRKDGRYVKKLSTNCESVIYMKGSSW